MLSLESFGMSDLQNLVQLLNELEDEGVTDIRFVRQRVANHIDAKALAFRAESRSRRQRRPVYSKMDICPSCGARQVAHTQAAGEVVMTCRKCRWSKYVGPIEVI